MTGLPRIQIGGFSNIGEAGFLPNFKISEVAQAGDFVHIPRGETHGAENASETEEVHLVFCYPGVPDKEGADTVFVE